MATTNFKYQVEQFLRRIGQGNITITLANPTTFALHFSPSPVGITIDQIYDAFLFSGQCLFKAYERYSKGEVTKHLPGFQKRLPATSLSSGEWTPDIAIERIIEPVIVRIAGSEKICYKIPDTILEHCINTLGNRSITSDYPGYYIRDKKISVIPNTATHIRFSYIQSVPRLLLSDQANDVDIWPANDGVLLIDGAVMYFKGDTNESNLEQLFFNRLNIRYKELSVPIQNQNNSAVEQL